MVRPGEAGSEWWLRLLPRSEPGKSSYAACHHDVEAPIDEDNHGAFFLNSHVRVVDVTDGLSQTIFLGEVPWRLWAGWVSGTRATLRNTGHPINGLTAGAVLLAAGGSSPYRDFDRSESWTSRSTRAISQVAPTFVGGFGSSHPGKRGELRIWRWIGAVSQADDRSHGLSAARSSVRRRNDR